MQMELFEEMDYHLMNDEKPSAFFEKLYLENALIKKPFSMLADLKKCEQSPKHHPEGNVWNHTMLVIDEAAKRKTKSNNLRAFMWGALLHDIGKPPATKKKGEKITSYDHDKIGSRMAAEFLSYFDQDEKFVSIVSSLVRWHMQILFVIRKMPFADIKNMKAQTDINEIALLGLCDRMGRLNSDIYSEEKNIEQFLEKCISYKG